MIENKNSIFKKISEYKKTNSKKKKLIKLNHIDYLTLNGLKKIKKRW